jgi:site-specific DNA-cytosine methylase
MPRSLFADFEFIDLFAGIGGMRRGFESVGGRCIFTSEWDRFSQKTYAASYHDRHEIAGDITKVHETDVPPLMDCDDSSSLSIPGLRVAVRPPPSASK